MRKIDELAKLFYEYKPWREDNFFASGEIMRLLILLRIDKMRAMHLRNELSNLYLETKYYTGGTKWRK